ncbi:MAG: hemolysin family protein [Syntrophobacterales bacterium]|nr:hemolysin family protein [Syntrophobacterales bacterium]
MNDEQPVRLLRWLKKFFRRVSHARETDDIEKEIQQLIDEGEEEGVITEDEGEMIQGIFSFRDTIAREVMVPRIDVTALKADEPIEEVVRTIVESGHSRIPIYEDTLDNIIGIVHAKDLLKYWGQKGIEASRFVRPPYYVPETTKISVVFQELRSRKSHMAVVLDEYGGTAGILTLEDIIEEIIGDIMDEYDHEEVWIVPNQDGSIIVDARLDVEDLEDYLKMDLPEGKFESVGGLIISLLGRVPRKGEKVVVEGIEMEILLATDRKIEKVVVRRLQPKESPTAVVPDHV